MTEVLPRPRAIDAAVFTDVLSRTLTVRQAEPASGYEKLLWTQAWQKLRRSHEAGWPLNGGAVGLRGCPGVPPGRTRHARGRRDAVVPLAGREPPATASWSAGHGCMPSRSWTSERTSSRPSASSTGPGSGHHVRPQAPGHAGPVGTDRRRRRRPLLPLRTAHPARPGMASGSHGRGPHPLPRPVSRPLQRPGRSVGQRETLGTAPTGNAATAHHHPSLVSRPPTAGVVRLPSACSEFSATRARSG